MKILYIHCRKGNAGLVDGMMMTALLKLGYTVLEYDRRLITDRASKEEVDLLSKSIKEQEITHLFSIHFSYDVAIAAYDSGVKYIAYLWDAPYMTVHTTLGKLNNCWYSTFDKIDLERMKKVGIAHVLYQPLAVNADDFFRWNLYGNQDSGSGYRDEISFVGMLYDNNPYDQNLDKFPQGIQSYFESIFEEAAFRWDGENRIYGKVDKDILAYIKLLHPDFSLGNITDLSDTEYFEMTFLVRKIAHIERSIILSALAEKYDVSLYTRKLKEDPLPGNVKIMPPAPWGEAAARVYAGSKINLNIALKGIEGGTAQRVMEAMAAGGFMLTNYCPETAEIFEEDKEIVMFKTPEELFDKVDYYLHHDEERREIAKRGQEKVLTQFTYEKKLKKLLDWIESEG